MTELNELAAELKEFRGFIESIDRFEARENHSRRLKHIATYIAIKCNEDIIRCSLEEACRNAPNSKQTRNLNMPSKMKKLTETNTCN